MMHQDSFHNHVLAWIPKIIFRARATTGLVVVSSLLLTGEMRAQNILSNPGFEMGSFTNWTTFQSNNYIESGSPALSGNYYYKVYGQFSGVTNFTGIYQENPSAPGNTYSADGWAYSLSSDGGGIHGDDSIWIEVTFQDASYNALADYRSDVVTGNTIASFGGLNNWFDLLITNQCSFTNASALILSPGTVTNTVTSLVAPAGTAYVRYQVVFAQGADNANGSMYFDDLTLNQTGGTNPPATQWNIVWDDEFNGTSINTTNWTFDLGNNGGWGNNELEYYTDSPNNAYVSNGLLNIVVLQQSMNGFNYTSARMLSQGLYNTPTYGRMVWRAALPAGTGMWPALWMLGSDYSSVGWPDCGEIDVVENNGASPNFVQGSLHDPNGGPTSVYDLPGGESTTNFHIYELDWESNSISWYVDGQLYETQSGGAPFNQPFFFIMNVAVGGNYVGNPTTNQINSGTVFPQTMQVDYVRIYEQTAPLQISTTLSNGNFILSWPTNIVCHLQTQTNSLTSGNWSDMSNTTNPFVIVPDPSQSSVFYQLESP
ncbi:MAG: family 16 glycosylhydrolase [Verrucomicrobiota bacterium]|jgi:beta-glucanase (GH16 family)